jgi:hypothetical protein
MTMIIITFLTTLLWMPWNCLLNRNWCRICDSENIFKSLMKPCSCLRSLSHVHPSCLILWLRIRNRNKCEMCEYKIEVIGLDVFSKCSQRDEKTSMVVWFDFKSFSHMLHLVSRKDIKVWIFGIVLSKSKVG